MRVAALLAAFVLVLAACGSDGDAGEELSDSGTTDTAPSEEPSVNGEDSSGQGVAPGELPGGLDDLGDESGVITYTLADGGVYRVEAREGAEPENLSERLDEISSGGGDEGVSVSPDGQWLLVNSERFGCDGWACLAVVDADLGNAEVVEVDGEPLRPVSFSALGPDGDLIVYESEEGPHESDLWATSREDGDWATPVLLSGESEHDYHFAPAVSDDGTMILFDCGLEPWGAPGTNICQVSTDGSGLETLVSPEDGPDGSTDNALHTADFEADGSIVFEADWQGGEALWRAKADGSHPTLISDAFVNDNSPCVLPNGRVVSLWLERPDSEGFHELKVMDPEGAGYIMVVVETDVADIGLGCAA